MYLQQVDLVEGAVKEPSEHLSGVRADDERELLAIPPLLENI